MKVLYLSETSSLTTVELSDLLDFFIKHDMSSNELKYISESLDAQCFYIGYTNFCGSIAIIQLDMNNVELLILPKKIALKGISELSYPG